MATAVKNRTSKTSVLLTAAATTFMAPFMVSSVNIALPAIQREFTVNAVMLGWIANAYLLATGVFLVPAGKLSDIHGRRRVFIGGIFSFTLFTVLTAFVPSVAWMIVLRVLQGVGAAMTMATGIAIISAVFPPNERGQAIGITVASVYIGLSVGPFAGGLLTGAFGWRSLFLIIGPMGLAAFFLAFTRIRDEWADAAGERFDTPGSLLYGVSLMAFMYGLSALPSTPGAAFLGAGLAGFVVFVRHELRTVHPVFEVRMFLNNRAFSFSSIAALVNYAATFGVGFLMSLYLQYIQGFSPEGAGTLLVCQPVVMALLSPVAGKLSDRIEPAVIASVGMALTAAGLTLLVFLNRNTPTGYIVLGFLVLGLGFALFSSPNMNAIMGSVDRRSYGIAASTVATMRLIGQMFSMTIATLVFSLVIGDVAIAPENDDAFLYAVNVSFTLFALLCTAGIYFSWARGAIRGGSSGAADATPSVQKKAKRVP